MLGSRGDPEEELFISGEGSEGHGERPGKVLCGGSCRHEAGVPQQRAWGHGLAQALQSRETRQVGTGHSSSFPRTSVVPTDNADQELGWAWGTEGTQLLRDCVVPQRHAHQSQHCLHRFWKVCPGVLQVEGKSVGRRK